MTIRTDPQADRRGSYGRLLVYLTHDGELFNRQLLRQGYARLYESEFSKRSSFADVEASAQRIAHGEIIPPVSEVHLRPTSD